MKYKVYCETDGKWEEFDSLMPREECPVNAAHTVRAGSLCGEEQATSDYKVLRNALMVQVATEGFANLTTEEKKIASENFVVSKADRDTIHTVSEQIQNGIEFHRKSTESRHARRIAAEAEVYNRILDGLEQADLMNDVTALLDNYVNFGIEGTLEGDVEGLFDYLESRVGTSFETTGLMSKTYTIEGMTLAQLRDRLMDIFANGNY